MLRAIAAGLLSGLVAAAPAWAETYPVRPVTMVVPYAAGGTTDVLTRIVGQAMGADLGQSVVVENVGGAGGTMGTLRVARSEPDGYTLNFGNMGSLAANVTLYPKLRYDPRKDLAPIGLVATVPMVLSVSNASGIRDLPGFVARLRQGDLKLGHAGIGATSHLAALAFLSETGTKATLVAYRGSGPAINDLAAGVVDAVFDQTVTMIPMHTGGNVRAIAVSNSARLPQLPDVPTFAEAGVPRFDLTVWNAIAAPKDTPPQIVARLEDALGKALADPTVRARFDELAALPPTPDQVGAAELGRLIERDVERLGRLLREAGVKTE